MLTGIRIYIGYSYRVMHVAYNGLKLPGLATLIVFITICDVSERDDFIIISTFTRSFITRSFRLDLLTFRGNQW